MLNPPLLLGAAFGLVLSVNSYPIATLGDMYGEFRAVQAHRGGLGMRPESTIFAFAYALEIGVDVLEMDTVFTQDEIPVIWHDHWIEPEKCKDTVQGAKYVGKYIANLTLSQVQTLDCGSQQTPGHEQAKLYPGAKIPTLEEVLDLIDCYGDKRVKINLETKLDPVHPNETLPASKYINDLVPILERRGYANRTYIQSFDWRTLIGIKKLFPQTTTIALLDPLTVGPEDPQFPWLGGLDLQKDFSGDWVSAAHSIGASVLSPAHGTPASASVNSPTYTPFTTAEIVSRAHELGMEVIPWTADDEVTIDKLFSDGVDAIISNYPERVMWVGSQRGARLGHRRNPTKAHCFTHARVVEGPGS